MRQHYNLGQQMRKEYINTLLSENFNHTEMLIYSTDFNRTIISASSHLYGMYPPETGPKILKVDSQYLLSPYKGLKDNSSGEFALPNGF